MEIGLAVFGAPLTSVAILFAVGMIGGAAFCLGQFWDQPDHDERHFGIALVAIAVMLFLTAISWQLLFQVAFASAGIALVVIAMRRLSMLQRKPQLGKA